MSLVISQLQTEPVHSPRPGINSPIPILLKSPTLDANPSSQFLAAPPSPNKCAESPRIRFAPLPSPGENEVDQESGSELMANQAPPSPLLSAGPFAALERIVSSNSTRDLTGVNMNREFSLTSVSSSNDGSSSNNLNSDKKWSRRLLRSIGINPAPKSENISRRRSTGLLAINWTPQQQRAQEFSTEGVVKRGRSGSNVIPGLNGRVYRANSRAPGPVKVEEPEFSEWGARSLGSVRTADEDEDDGSGLAWIKKRRAAREAAKAAELAQIQVASESPKLISQEHSPQTSKAATMSPAEVHRQQSPDLGSPRDSEVHHVLPVNVPAHTYYKSGQHHRTSAKSSPRISEGATSPGIESTFNFSPVVNISTDPGVYERKDISESSDSDSDEDDDESSLEDSEGNSAEDEEDNSDDIGIQSTTLSESDQPLQSQSMSRKTASSAGMEKLSTHSSNHHNTSNRTV